MSLDNTQMERLEHQIRLLSERGVSISSMAKDVMVLAIAAIADEPARDWPKSLLNDRERQTLLQNQFIDAFAYHFISASYRVNSASIEVFDAIEYTAYLRGSCCKIIAEHRGINPTL